MFYTNYCWAVICYPICVTNISYEWEIILLSLLVISFVILIFVFLRFEIKSWVPFYWLALYTSCCLHCLLFLQHKNSPHHIDPSSCHPTPAWICRSDHSSLLQEAPVYITVSNKFTEKCLGGQASIVLVLSELLRLTFTWKKFLFWHTVIAKCRKC